MVLDSETLYINSLSTIATAAIAGNSSLLLKKMSLKEYTFCNDNI